MFNLTGTEIVVILLLALVILGPEKLPDAVRRVGRAYAELRRMGTGFQQEFKSALDEPVREMRASADMLRRSADFTAEPEHVEQPTEVLPFGTDDAPDDAPGAPDDVPDVPDGPDAPDAPGTHDDPAAGTPGSDDPGPR